MSASLVGQASIGKRRQPPHSLLLLVVFGALLAVSPRAHSEPINNLEQLGFAVHDGVNSLSQIGIGLQDFSYAAGDGSVRTVAGDGSVRFISVGAGVSAALCFHGVSVSGTRCAAHHVLRSSRSFRNTVRWSGFSGKSGNTSRNFAIIVELVRRRNTLICVSTSSVVT